MSLHERAADRRHRHVRAPASVWVKPLTAGDHRLALVVPDELIGAIAGRAAAIVLNKLAGEARSSPYLTMPKAAAYPYCERQRIDDLLSARRLARHKDGRRTLILRGTPRNQADPAAPAA